MSGPQKGPLAGVRVLELARVLAGPWCGQTLADLGAEVIKVERPGAGDDTRGWGPPFMEDKDGGRLSRRTIRLQSRQALDRHRLRDAGRRAGRQETRGALRRADREFQVRRAQEVRPRLRKPVSATNPGLVYCSITGFGQNGPYKRRAGYDLLIQGTGGIMDITGSPGGEPTRLGVAFADVFTGTYSALAITAALKERETTGKGSHIDMALLDTMVGVLANQGHLLSGLRRAAGADGRRQRQRGAVSDLPDHGRLDADRLRRRGRSS